MPRGMSLAVKAQLATMVMSFVQMRCQFVSTRSLFFNHAGQLMSQSQRPRQRFGPVSTENMQVGAANSTSIDPNQSRSIRYVRPRHTADLSSRAGSVKC